MPVLTEARFEQYILERGLVSEEDVKKARAVQAESRTTGVVLNLAQAVLKAGVMTDGQVRRVLAALKEETLTPQTLQIPGIELLERIGRGSQAVVYKARQVSVDRIVAVKVLLSKTARDPEARRRLVQEARTAAKLAHNNIVQAIDAGEIDGYPYFVQEFIDGTTLYDELKRLGHPMAEQRALEITVQIAEALAHAHSRGLIHRDVKPKNIMLTREGVAKLADMGLARQADDAGLDEVGKAFGTPYYISPEQVMGNPNIDSRADIYSLGATFYEMLTGRPPFLAPTPQQVMQKHVSARLVPPDHVNQTLSAGASEVIEVMLSKRPEDRYATPEELLMDLRSVAAGQPPRIAREKVGMGAQLLEGLAAGDQVRPEDRAPPKPANPLALNTLGWILLVLLALSVILNIIQTFVDLV